MILRQCMNPKELIPFLKLDYANNLYFFTYLSESTNSETVFLTLTDQGETNLVLLISPMHCCVSTTDVNHIFALDGLLPPINSVHVVGRRDYIEPLLTIITGPEREQHPYALSEFSLDRVTGQAITKSQRASRFDLNELIDFYNHNDMLMDAENRLPGILTWGNAYFMREDSKIVSCALTTTETNDAAMIGSVFTIPQYRNRGYAKICIMGLCKNLLENDKKPHLFYDSDDSFLGNFYHSLGFQSINTWILASRIQQ